MMLRGKSKSPYSFIRNKKGAAAVEFALIAPILLGLVFSSFELGFAMMKITTVDHAVAKATKLIYTGAATTGGITQKQMEDIICEELTLFRNCENNISVELAPVSSFRDRLSGNVICRDSANPPVIAPSITYNPGANDQVLIMRVCLISDLITPGIKLGLRMPTTSTGRSQIVSTTAFRNEP